MQENHTISEDRKPVEEILSELVPMVADILVLELDEIEPTSRFFEDLGAESIDALELSFRCEKHFGAKLNFQSMLPIEELPVDEHGRLTDEAVAELKGRLPFLDLSRLEPERSPGRIRELFTISAIAHFIHQAIAAGGPARRVTEKPAT